MPTSLLSKVSHALTVAKAEGWREFMAFVSYRVHENFQEWKLGIGTTALVSSEELGHQSPEFLFYAPAPYRALRYCLARIRIRPDQDVFLDYGCGMGRAIVVAATRPFRRVMGVEISPQLAEMARRNVRGAKGLRCEVSVEVADARTYQVPDDVTVIHFCNPFTGHTLAQAIANIQESLRRRPRDLTIFYGNSRDFERLADGWVTLVASRVFYPRISYALYVRRAGPDSR